MTVSAGQPIREGRLAGTGRAEKDERLRGLEELLHRVDPLTGDVAHGQDGDADGDRLGRGELVEVVAHVELREHDHGIRSRVPGRDQVALETARVEVLVEARHEEDGVDVRDENVLLGLEPRRLARHLRAAREERLDREAVTGCVADDDPVADRGHPAPELVVAQAPACARKSVTELGAHVVPAPMLCDDACGEEAALFIGCEGRLELIGPAEGGQGSIGHQKTPCSVGEPGRGS